MNNRPEPWFDERLSDEALFAPWEIYLGRSHKCKDPDRRLAFRVIEGRKALAWPFAL
jgi:hypothetical protein